MFDMSVSKKTRSPTFWRKSATDPGVTVVDAAAAVSCWLLLQAAMTSITAMAAKALIVLIFHRLLTTSTRALGDARVDKKDHILRYCGIKGDQAGSEASPGVGI